jgi:hypothetical protein
MLFWMRFQPLRDMAASETWLHLMAGFCVRETGDHVICLATVSLHDRHLSAPCHTHKQACVES